MKHLYTANLWVLLYGVCFYSHVYAAGGEGQEFDSLLELDISDLMGAKVSIASKREENISDAPSIVSVVTAQEIRQYGARNLMDVFNRVTSMQGLASHFYSNIVGMRGQLLKHSNNEILFLVNGRPHRTSWNGGTNYSLLLSFPLHAIERIEIIRGPGSVLYGSSAFAGTVNIITKSAESMGDAEMSISYGSFDSKGAEIVVASGDAEWGALAGAKWFDSNGWSFKATGETGVSDRLDMSEDDTGIIALANYKGFSTNVLYTSSERDNLGQGARWPMGSQKINHLLLDTGFKQTISESWSAEYHITYNDFDFSVLNSDDRGAQDILTEVTATGKLQENVNLLFGGVYEHQDGNLDDDNSYSSYNYSLYAQADYIPLDSLKLTAGVQRNKVKNLDANNSPRIALISNFSENWGAKILYGEAFRSSYATESFVDTARIKGNPVLKPEEIATAEAQLFYHSKRYYTSLSYFHSEITDVITRAPIGGGVFEFVNDGEIKFDGLELEAKATLSDSFQVVGSITHQRNEDDDGTEDVTLAPNIMVKLGAVYESVNGYSLGIFDAYFGKPTAVEELNPSVSTVNPEPESYHLFSANLFLDIPVLLKKLNLPDMFFSLYVDNLLDEEIHYPEINRKRINSIPIHSGRAVYGKLTIKL